MKPGSVDRSELPRNVTPVSLPATEVAGLPKRIPKSIVGWMYPFELLYLYQIAKMLAEWGVEGDLLEVGSYKGLSASALGQAGKLTCVDTFDGGEGIVPGFGRAEFDQAMRTMDLHPRVLVGPSADILGNLVVWGERFRLVFVDASHEYANVKIDLALSWTLLSPGGFLVADDYVGFPDVTAACDESGYGFVKVEPRLSKMAVAHKTEEPI